MTDEWLSKRQSQEEPTLDEIINAIPIKTDWTKEELKGFENEAKTMELMESQMKEHKRVDIFGED